MDTPNALALLLLVLDVVLVIAVLRAERHLGLERAAEAGRKGGTGPEVGPGPT
jgi:hypothetical protein